MTATTAVTSSPSPSPSVGSTGSGTGTRRDAGLPVRGHSPAPDAASPGASRKSEGVIAFHLGDEIFAADMTSVREIIKISAITPLYRVDDFFMGLINLRGQIKPVIDLAIFLGLPHVCVPHACVRDSAKAELPAVVITDGESDLVCMVDRIEKVRWLSAEDMREVSQESLSGNVREDLKRYVKATARTGEKPVSLLDTDQIIKSSVWEKYR